MSLPIFEILLGVASIEFSLCLVGGFYGNCGFKDDFLEIAKVLIIVDLIVIGLAIGIMGIMKI